MGEQEVQASWSRRVGQVGPTYCPGACGGRGPGTSVTCLGPPAGPLLESILGQLGSPRGAIQRQGVAQQGLPRTKGAPRHLHVKAGEGGVYCILSRALKHSCGVPLGPAFLRRRKEAGPPWPGSLIKQLPPGTHRPAAGAPKCAHKPCNPVKVRPCPAGLRARGSGPGVCLKLGFLEGQHHPTRLAPSDPTHIASRRWLPVSPLPIPQVWPSICRRGS